MSDIPSNPSGPQDDLYKYYDTPPQQPVRPDQQTAQQFHQEVYTNPNDGTIHIQKGKGGDGPLNIYITNENININGRPSNQAVPMYDGAPNYSQYFAPRPAAVPYSNYAFRPPIQEPVMPFPGQAYYGPQVQFDVGFGGGDRFHDPRFRDDRFRHDDRRDPRFDPRFDPRYMNRGGVDIVLPQPAPSYYPSTAYYSGNPAYYSTGGAPYYASPSYYSGGAAPAYYTSPDSVGGATPYQWAGLAANTGVDIYALSQIFGRRR